MLSKIDTLLSKAILEKGMLSQEVLTPLIDEAQASKESLFAALLKKNILTEEVLLKSVSDLIRIPVLDLPHLKPEAGATEKVPLKVAEYYRMLPMKLEKRKLTVAVSAPLDLRTQDDIRAHLGYEVDYVLAREKDITEALKKTYGLAAGTIGEMMASTPAQAVSLSSDAFEKIESIENVEKMAGDASIAKLVNQIILEAFRKRSTDIHIEPYRGKVKLRYRIDGLLYNANVPPEIGRFIQPILSRIKIMANLNIVEKRLPQDGRAIVKVEETTLDLRVSSIPTPYGESVVIRLLPTNRIFDLGQLGLNADQLKIFDGLINKPHGIIFITGPTGSGKSTTLYACLNKINTEDRKIITIEDPVEYEMEGVTQIQVSSNIGLDFAKGLRSMLRHDPDVMMVGEVRDLETAEMAIRVALTGHLVFSTLHTNDSASGATRLVDIGIAPYLVASSIEAFIAQRLVRTLCQKCKEEDTDFSPEIKKQIGRELNMATEKFKVYRGKGCDTCNFSGFWGRLAIYEILLLNDSLKQLVTRKATAGEIKRQAVKLGMRTLRQDGWLKVIGGLTTPSEIIEATQDDEDHSFMQASEVGDDNKLEGDFLEALNRHYPQIKRQGGGLTGEERRIFLRLDCDHVAVFYRVIKVGTQESLSTTLTEERTLSKNISAGGILFYSNELIIAGSILELRFQIPASEDRIECLARVVRCEKIEVEGIYEVGSCFLDLSAKDRAKLERFIEKEAK